MKLLEHSRSLTEEERAVLIKCHEAIRAVDPSTTVILYGSRARGDAQPDSDYDLLVLTDNEATLESEDNLRKQLFPLELASGAVLTLMLLNKREWNSPRYKTTPFYQNVERDGVFM